MPSRSYMSPKYYVFTRMYSLCNELSVFVENFGRKNISRCS
ncbi:hypothetical protein SLEP1_g45967 [Rubroshorea leprosula]|uniref:Uncharacterized protein n=1 Tax=Rubroshorea leprosula TaxID=152421 RepID=A0AAV5LLJ2_9ROSI|nr:hypothetical protein SLEP1_g45967 [Rubroshorea leprosula]